jgi:hypothetical protein
MDRLSYAFIGAVLGAVLATVCWWLYGLALSLRYSGPGIDPQLIHWVKVLGGAFAILGFAFKDKVGSLAGDALAGIFNFEANHAPTEHVSWWQVLLTVVLAAGLLWFLMRG